MNLLATRARKPSNSSKPATMAVSGPVIKKEDPLPTLDDMISCQDYTGAVTLLEFLLKTGDEVKDTKSWLAYSYFHLGDFQKALDIYTTMLEKNTSALDTETQTLYLYKAACLFYLGEYEEALAQARRGPSNMLQNRIMLHTAQKLKNEELVAKCSEIAQKGGAEDLLSLSALYYDSCQYQDATDAYRNILQEYPHYDTINIYLALCCYKLDHFNFGLEFLKKYLTDHPQSASAMNLRACSYCRLFKKDLAAPLLNELSMKLASSSLPSPPVIAHNNVVIREGENALQVLPPLIDVIPEARFNLITFHLLNDNYQQAYALIKDVTPQTPQEYIIKGVVYACLAVEEDLEEEMRQAYLREAEIWLHGVGSSSSEKDTIPGRKCMAQVFFFQQKWTEVILYLTSIEEYCGYDSALNYNLGIAYAANGDFKESLAHLQLVEGPLAQSVGYTSWYCRALIYTGDPASAWQLYLDTDTNYSLGILRAIASDCYKCGHFYFAAKAYDMLCKLDGGEQYEQGRRGSIMGVVQLVASNLERKDVLREFVIMLSTEQDEDLRMALETWIQQK